jgi:bifunctional non-homologous end joining protein LigD
MLWRLRPRRSPVGFIEPCLPSPAPSPPSGPEWIHEIKHDGYRLMARRDGAGVRLLTRNGYDWTDRFPLVAAAVNLLKLRSCLIDGEIAACDADGLTVFEMLRRGPRTNPLAILYAFDLLELDGADLRGLPLEERKGKLAKLLRQTLPSLQLSEHLAGDGEIIFHHELCCREPRAQGRCTHRSPPLLWVIRQGK